MGVRLAILCIFVTLNIFLAYKAIWGTGGLLDHNVLKARQRAAEEECRKMDLANMQLSREIRLLQSDDDYVERQIRERLHYLRANEVLYLFEDEPMSAGKKP